MYGLRIKNKIIHPFHVKIFYRRLIIIKYYTVYIQT